MNKDSESSALPSRDRLLACAEAAARAGGRAEITPTGSHYQLKIVASNAHLHAPLRRLIAP